MVPDTLDSKVQTNLTGLSAALESYIQPWSWQSTNYDRHSLSNYSVI